MVFMVAEGLEEIMVCPAQTGTGGDLNRQEQAQQWKLLCLFIV